jgi:hypothetical protein
MSVKLYKDFDYNQNLCTVLQSYSGIGISVIFGILQIYDHISNN